MIQLSFLFLPASCIEYAPVELAVAARDI